MSPGDVGPRPPLVDVASRRWATIGVAFAVFAATFLFRYLTVDFPNDHFVHLARARQILAGEVPVWDFFDEGRFLTYYASAAALVGSGHTLLGEAILTVGCIALGTAVTYLLSARMAASVPIGLIAAGTAVATLPRLYNYQKVVLYALAIAGASMYVGRRSGWQLALLALLTAVAFLFRHDHGLFIGLFLVTFLLVLHWSEPVGAGRVVRQYAGMTALLLLPWGLFVQSGYGLWTYLRGTSPQAADASTLRILKLPVHVDLSAPLLVVDPPAESRVLVRWAASASEADIRLREKQFGLTKKEADEGRTFRYVLADDSPGVLRSLVGDPLVEDTAGLDRQTLRVLDRSTPYQRLRRRVALLRTHLAPGVFTNANALAWLYYGGILLPILGMVCLWRAWARGRLSRAEGAMGAALVVLSVVTFQGMVRGQPQVRLADVAVPLVVLGAWVTGQVLGRSAADSPLRTRGRRGVIAVLWIVTIWSAGSVGQVGAQLELSGLVSGPIATWQRFRIVSQQLGRSPFEAWAEDRDTGLQGLVRYVRACTAPSSRLFVAWFDPQIYFYSERLFAGGQVVLDPGFPLPLADQQLTVERLSRQQVPLVLADATLKLDWFEQNFPVIAAYLREHYTIAAETTFDSAKVFYVLVERGSKPMRVYEPFNLPCYQ